MSFGLMQFFLSILITSKEVINGIILGIVQGISEWLPISSKTQIIIASNYLLHLNFNTAYVFGLFMEIGTIFAAMIYFRKEIYDLIKVILGNRTEEKTHLFKYVFVSTLVTGIIGTPIYLIVDSLNGAYNLGIPALIIGVVLIMDAIIIKMARSKYNINKNRRELKDLGYKDYILVGIAQGIAALPGVSRSGTTTSTLLLLNTDAKDAFRLSFIDMIFATGAAIALTVIASRHTVESAVASVSIPGLIISIIVATGISLLLIDFLIKEAKKTRIVYITAALGIIAIIGGIMILFLG